MKKLIIVLILCLPTRLLAVNPADTTADYRLMPKLFCASYNEEATRAVFGALPFNDSMVTVYNRTKEKEIKSYLVFASQFSSWIDGGTKMKLVQNRDNEDIEMTQEIGLDVHQGNFGLGTVIPFQGRNTMIGVRAESKYFVGYLHYEAEGWWSFGTDLKAKGFKTELAYNDDEELYLGMSYSLKTPWGCFIPCVFSDDDVFGGKLLFIY